MCSAMLFCFLNVRAYLIYLCCYLLIMVAAGSRVVNGLKCYCNPKECDVIRSLDCPGKGIMIWDPCKCCRICAKTLGETCGGPGDFSGQCEPPLQCVSRLPINSGLGVCMNLPISSSASTYQNRNCTKYETISVAPGCEITNKRCQCWPTLHICSNRKLLNSLFDNGSKNLVGIVSSNNNNISKSAESESNRIDGATSIDTRWHFKTLEDCQLNLQNLMKLEMEFDEDYTIAPTTTFTYKKLRRKARVLRKHRLLITR